jgi:hypothetical protein
MITRSPDEPENVIWQQKMLSIGGASGLCLDAKFEPSPDFVDFLLMCFADKGDMRRVSKVGWPQFSRIIATEHQDSTRFSGRHPHVRSTHSCLRRSDSYCGIATRSQWFQGLAKPPLGRRSIWRGAKRRIPKLLDNWPISTVSVFRAREVGSPCSVRYKKECNRSSYDPQCMPSN